MNVDRLVRTLPIPLAATLLIIGAAQTGAAQSLPFSSVYVFGDSNVDTGNLFLATGGVFPPSPPYDSGRNSNGPLWVEMMAGDLGLPIPAPSSAGGTNYAWAGAETGPGLSGYDLPNIGMQIELFLDAEDCFHGEELIVLQAGYNDLYFDRGVEAVVDNFVEHITALEGAGARYFLVATVAGEDSPLIAESSSGKRFRKQVAALNRLLEKRLRKLAKKLGVTIAIFDYHEATTEILEDSCTYGLTNIRDGFLTGAGGIGEPDVFFWWDDIHPTRVVNAAVGEAATESVSRAFAAPCGR